MLDEILDIAGRLFEMLDEAGKLPNELTVLGNKYGVDCQSLIHCNTVSVSLCSSSAGSKIKLRVINSNSLGEIDFRGTEESRERRHKGES